MSGSWIKKSLKIQSANVQNARSLQPKDLLGKPHFYSAVVDGILMGTLINEVIKSQQVVQEELTKCSGQISEVSVYRKLPIHDDKTLWPHH